MNFDKVFLKQAILYLVVFKISKFWVETKMLLNIMCQCHIKTSISQMVFKLSVFDNENTNLHIKLNTKFYACSGVSSILFLFEYTAVMLDYDGVLLFRSVTVWLELTTQLIRSILFRMLLTTHYNQDSLYQSSHLPWKPAGFDP